MSFNLAYEPKLTTNLQAHVYVGSDIEASFGTPHPFFRGGKFRAYAGFSAEAWVYTYGHEYVFVDKPFGSQPSTLRGSSETPSFDSLLRLDGAQNSNSWKVRSRPWRERPMNIAPPSITTIIQDFQIGNLDSKSSDALQVVEAAFQLPRPIAAATSTNLNGEPPLVANVFPDSEPVLAEKNGELLLLYTRDNGSNNDQQFSSIAWLRYDGDNWSATSDISPVPNAQFSPQVQFDGDGEAIAVWEQIRDATFVSDTLENYAAEMELVFSVWNDNLGTWTTPEYLTDNGFLDSSPKLVGPLTDGDLLLCWIENPSNNPVGDLDPTSSRRALMRRWDTATNTWGNPIIVADPLQNSEAHDFAGAGGLGVFAWTIDLDGDPSTPNDSEVLLRCYDSASDTLSPITQVTDDSVYDGGIRIAVGNGDDFTIVWRRGGDLVSSTGTKETLLSEISVVKLGADSIVFRGTFYRGNGWV